MRTMEQVRDALKVLRPNDGWGIAGTEITMLSGTMPSEEELQAEIDRQLAGPTEEELLQQWREQCRVSRFQAFQALDDFGLLDAVEQWASQQEGKERRAFDMAQEFRYTSPTLEAARQAMGITDEQKDALFQHAETIEA